MIKSATSNRRNVLSSYTNAAPYPTVFVHGAGENNLLWKRTLQPLSGGSLAYAVNLPGHPSGEITCKSISEYSRALLEFIQQSGLRSPVVAGHSMGSAVAITLAIEHPELIGGLIIVSGGAKLGVDRTVLDGLRSEAMKTIENAVTPMSFYAVDLALGREARSALSTSNLPVFLNDYLACAAFDERQRLYKIRAKTLVVCGDADRMTPPKWAHYLQANIEGAELRFIRDAGHMLPIEKPAVLAGMIQAFLEGLSR
jgi:pimeloyl-ACP methyl ester carboxylesterase